jgi:predicted TIM-barrel fold metal-dependent hydrolase
MDDHSLSRRTFLQTSGALGLAHRAAGAATPAKVIDCHAHLHMRHLPTWREDDAKLIDAADKLGIDKLCCSLLTQRRPSTADQFRECNRQVAESMKRFPGRVLGYAYVNPGYTREALEDVRRCVEERGFVGIKLYNEYRITEPVLFPLVELAIELRIPILSHAGHLHHFLEEQPRISDGGHIAELARRYPEAMLICAHVAGGGDWEWTIQALRNAPTVYLDTSGSVIDEGTVEMAVRLLGADRVVFGCDMSMTASVGRIRSADLTPVDRAKILGGNMSKILARRRA